MIWSLWLNLVDYYDIHTSHSMAHHHIYLTLIPLSPPLFTPIFLRQVLGTLLWLVMSQVILNFYRMRHCPSIQFCLITLYGLVFINLFNIIFNNTWTLKDLGPSKILNLCCNLCIVNSSSTIRHFSIDWDEPMAWVTSAFEGIVSSLKQMPLPHEFDI